MTRIVDEKNHPFKSEFIVLCNENGWYIFSYSHLGKLWSAWEVKFSCVRL